MELPPTTSPVQQRTSTCLQTFENLLSTRNLAEDDRVVVVDADARFRLWASNVGTDRLVKDAWSADSGLKEAPEIAIRLVEVLDEVQQILSEVKAIATGARPDASLVQDDEQLDDADTTGKATTELHELLLSISDSLDSLFKILTLIRKATHRDPYAIAARATHHPFLEGEDIRHVGERYPKIINTGQEWLQRRLGRAITLRRQFLWYCREQASRSSHAPESVLSTPPLVVPQQHGDPAESPLIAPSRPTLAPTKASANSQRVSALNLVDLVPSGGSDARSQATSFAPTRLVDSNGQEKLGLPKLEISCLHGRFLKCPYCKGVFQAKKQQDWKEHVLCDLRAYVCTFEDCDSGLFGDQESWFDHEIEAHRRQWMCPACPDFQYDDSDDLRTHLRKVHDTPVRDLDLVLRASSFPAVEVPSTSCMLCDEWGMKIRDKATAQGVPAESLLLVPIAELRKHLAQHMEQLALFAIPPAFEVDSPRLTILTSTPSVSESQSILPATTESFGKEEKLRLRNLDIAAVDKRQDEESPLRPEPPHNQALSGPDLNDLGFWRDNHNNIRASASGKDYAISPLFSTNCGTWNVESDISIEDILGSTELAQDDAVRSRTSRAFHWLLLDDAKAAVHRRREMLVAEPKKIPFTWILAYVDTNWLPNGGRKLLAVFELVEGQRAALSLEEDLAQYELEKRNAVKQYLTASRQPVWRQKRVQATQAPRQSISSELYEPWRNVYESC